MESAFFSGYSVHACGGGNSNGGNDTSSDEWDFSDIAKYIPKMPGLGKNFAPSASMIESALNSVRERNGREKEALCREPRRELPNLRIARVSTLASAMSGDVHNLQSMPDLIANSLCRFA